MGDWKICKLGEIVKVKGGKRLPKGINLLKIKNEHPYIRVRDLNNIRLLELTGDFEYVDKNTQKLIERYIVNSGDIVISIVGTIGLISIIGKTLNNANLTENCVKLINLKTIDKKYLYYYLTSDLGQAEIRKGTVGAVQAKLPIKNIQDISILLPPLIEQKAMARILSCLDDRIELNNKINDYLAQMAQAIFKSWFVDFDPFQEEELIESRLGPIPNGWQVGSAENYFDVSIGKTPPRQEHQWFSNNEMDNTWVSISDMGHCGMYISKSSEYLTSEAVEKFNIKIVPDNTILLSFKLTVGRITITDGQMATNEAIAHFKTANGKLIEFLYCYLKSFNYQSLGNTSSIATAVNSKIIKAMPILMPKENILNEFHNLVAPMFAQIKANQRESTYLTKTRDALLPKLMSGELSVSNS